MTIRAEFPLGTFLGHHDVGKRAPFPDTTRLFSALVHAASKGITAVERAGDLRMSAASAATLRWLEDHPPAALVHPDLRFVSARSASAWRAEGVFEKRGSAIQSRKTLKRQSDGVAVRGSFAWIWYDVPAEVRSVCVDLVGDVSCLGEADSPARLTVDDTPTEPTHRIAEVQTAFARPGGLAVRTPVAGRLDELNSDYDLGWGIHRPSVAQDKHTTSQLPLESQPSTRRVHELTYRPIQAATSSAPWTHAIVVPVDSTAGPSFGDPRCSVAWAVAMHRAIAACAGDDAPPILTGVYPAGADRPPNRVAIQCLPAGAPVAFDATGPAFVILIPESVRADDLLLLHRALASLRTVRISARARRKSDSGPVVEQVVVHDYAVVDAHRFWRPAGAGVRRLWAPRVPLIPEVRPHRRHGWDLETAAKVSIGHVWRDLLPAASSRAELVAGVEERGVAVYDAHLLLDSHVSRYVHKAPRNVVVQPYTCLVDLGDLASPQSASAIGQTRHLGGGLLVPVDIVAAPAVSEVRS
ncbi:MAG: type I-U CRISPR-associated protein Csb2 [Micropruina sp.]|uniref:type I-G CRISPR-associated protein Csb2 n=1 Tax=Micropruina sp. TaxID=2737536 RepID=UPI0039E2C41D